MVHINQNLYYINSQLILILILVVLSFVGSRPLPLNTGVSVLDLNMMEVCYEQDFRNWWSRVYWLAYMR